MRGLESMHIHVLWKPNAESNPAKSIRDVINYAFNYNKN